jgi:hypothetical protein
MNQVQTVVLSLPGRISLREYRKAWRVKAQGSGTLQKPVVDGKYF